MLDKENLTILTDAISKIMNKESVDKHRRNRNCST
jgi:hypothetical protein